MRISVRMLNTCSDWMRVDTINIRRRSHETRRKTNYTREKKSILSWKMSSFSPTLLLLFFPFIFSFPSLNRFESSLILKINVSFHSISVQINFENNQGDFCVETSRFSDCLAQMAKWIKVFRKQWKRRSRRHLEETFSQWIQHQEPFLLFFREIFYSQSKEMSSFSHILHILREQIPLISSSTKKRRRRQAISFAVRWTNNTLFYYFDNSISTSSFLFPLKPF